MPGLTLQIAEFAASFDLDRVPERALAAARIGMLDTVGVAIAGMAEPAAAMISASVEECRTNMGAPEILSGRMLSTADAALVNGVAGHVLDYDDVALDGHPSVILTPAILAEGYALDASGSDAIAAYVAGYEVWALLKAFEENAMHERGFHPTAVYGALGSAAACARLHGFDREKTAHAIAIAASLASGLVANFGTMTKSLHAGRAAQAGVLAARLARSGFTGALDVLEHSTGFLRAYSLGDDVGGNSARSDLGTVWRLEDQGVNIKRYPVCYATHRAIDAMLELTLSHDLEPDDVEEIHVHTGLTQRLILRNTAPRTALEAKFSMEFAMACALVRRHVGLSELTDELVCRDEIVAAMGKLRCTTTDETMKELPFAPADHVSVRLRNGDTLRHDPVTDALGSWKKPMDAAALRDKFIECCENRLPHGERLFEDLWRLRELPSLRMLPLGTD